MSERISSFGTFWPWYLAEHRTPRCRVLHFLGTGLFLGGALAGLALRPLPMAAGLAATLLIGAVGMKATGRAASTVALLLAGLPLIVAWPPVLGGMVLAYGFAWVGHFRVEGNRPATFHYPLWSLVADLRMWWLMSGGALWEGDPLQALGLEPAAAPQSIAG